MAARIFTLVMAGSSLLLAGAGSIALASGEANPAAPTAWACNDVNPLHYYVDVKAGNDKNNIANKPGKPGLPFATLERARDAIRAFRGTPQSPQSRAIVNIHQGTYPATTLKLQGLKDSCVTWRSYPGEDARIIGGLPITNLASLSPLTDAAALSRIKTADLKTKIKKVNLFQAFPATFKTANDFGELQRTSASWASFAGAIHLFFNDEPMQLARWPNGDWLEDIVPANPSCTPQSTDFWFPYDGKTPASWTSAVANTDDVWVFLYNRRAYEKVVSIDSSDPKCSKIETEGYLNPHCTSPCPHLTKTCTPSPPEYGIGSKIAKWFLINLLEELDEPGEWYLDRKTGNLYFYPPAGQAVSMQSPAYISIPDPVPGPKPCGVVRYKGNIFFLGKAQGVLIERLTLEIARDSAIIVEHGANNRIAGCTIRNAGRYAVELRRSPNSGVDSCEIYQTDGGVNLYANDSAKSNPDNMFVRNSRIHDYARWDQRARAVDISGNGGQVRYNCIHDAPGEAIRFGGKGNVIEYNEVADVARADADDGAVYAGAGSPSQGTELRYNYFHDIPRLALYLDDCHSGVVAYGNVFHRVLEGVHVGGGKDNQVQNNLFSDVGSAVTIDARGFRSPWNQEGNVCQTQGPPCGSLIIENVSYENDKDSLLVWHETDKEKFDDYRLANPACDYAAADNLDDWPLSSAHNFGFRPFSLPIKVGVQPVPFTEIGLYKDVYRTNTACGAR